MPPEPLAFDALAIVTGEYRIAGSAVDTGDDVGATLDLAASGKPRCEVHPRRLDEINDVLASMRRGRVGGRSVRVPARH